MMIDMELSQKKARKESSPSSASQQPGEDALQDNQRQALDLTLRCGYLSSDDMLVFCHAPLLASVFANLENWNGKTVAFELRTEADVERLVYLCSRYSLAIYCLIEI